MTAANLRPALARLMQAGLLALLSVFCTAAAADPMADGRARSQSFLDGDTGSIWSQMDAQMQGALGSEDALKQVLSVLRRDFGEEKEVLDEEVAEQDGYTIYLRTSQWSKAPTPLIMQWTFDREERIAGFFVRPKPVAADSRFLDYRTKAALRLPFEGEWFVFWGGRDIEQNYHAADRTQRFALDLVVRQGEASFEGDPANVESYHCWDQPILAPVSGTVVAAVNELPDQAIGSSDPAHPAGNHVAIDFGNGEFGFLAHMRKGSVTVKAGDRVEAGQQVGRCGNSGNTSEPHLHFHLQTTPDLTNGEGLPAQFVNYRADGKAVERGEPEQGQVVAPAD